MEIVAIKKTEMVRSCRENDKGRYSNDNMEVSANRKVERATVKWRDVIQNDMKETGVQREEAEHRIGKKSDQWNRIITTFVVLRCQFINSF